MSGRRRLPLAVGAGVALTCVVGSLGGAAGSAQAATGGPAKSILGVTEPASTQLAQAPAMVGAAFSPDGRQVVTANEDGSAKVWSSATGKEVVSFHEPACHRHDCSDSFTTVAYSPDGRSVLTASQDGTARLWDPVTGRQLAVFREPPCAKGCVGTGNAMNSAAFDASGSRIVTSSEDGTVRVWGVSDRRQLQVVNVVSASVEAQPATDAVFSPSANEIATAGPDDLVRLYNTQGLVLRKFTEPGGPNVDGGFATVAYSPDGSTVMAAATDGSTFVWNASNGALEAKLAEPPCTATTCTESDVSVNDASYSPNGDLVVTASNDGTARIWQLPSGHLVAVLHQPPHVASAVFNDSGTEVLSAGGDGAARVWTPGGQALQAFSVTLSQLNTAALSTSGTEMVTASNDGTARVFSVPSGHQLLTLNEGAAVTSAAVSANGSRLALVVGGNVKLLSSSGQLLATLMVPGGAQSVAFSPDATMVVTAGGDAATRVFSVPSGRQTVVLRSPRCSNGCGDQAVNQAAFTADGRHLVTASDDGTARVWDLSTGQVTATVAVPQEHSEFTTVVSVAANASGSELVTVGDNGELIGWETRPARRAWDQSPPAGPATVGVNPSGTEVVTANADGTASVLDLSSGQVLQTLPVGGTATSASFGGDHRLVTSSSRGRAVVWSW